MQEKFNANNPGSPKNPGSQKKPNGTNPGSPFPQAFHSLSVQETLKILQTGPDGLTQAEAELRLKKWGANEFEAKRPASVLDVFFRQFRSLIIIILFFAAVASIMLGDNLEAGIILALVLLTAVLGTFHEYRAEKALEALKKFQPSQVTVIRGGREVEIPSRELVPGDTISIKAGCKVPADCRLISEMRLRVDESVLTGESNPVSKQLGALSEKAIVAERRNMLFSSTLIVSGRALAAVCATDNYTEIGKIFRKISEERAPFPIQDKINDFSKRLGLLTLLGVAVLSILATSLLEYSLPEILKIAVAQAVSFIPEGLPIVVTIALALSVAEMARKKALTRKIPAIETIGIVSVICVDKTGTLTQNHMRATRIYFNSTEYEISGEREIRSGGKLVDMLSEPHFPELIKTGILCNDVSEAGKTAGSEPVESALMELGASFGYDKRKMDQISPRIGEIPFDPAKKYMLTMNTKDKLTYFNLKGAPEVVMGMCSAILQGGKAVPISQERKKEILLQTEKFAKEGLRVLGFAYKNSTVSKTLDSDFRFAGLIAFVDPLRPEARESVRKAQEAGIRVVMITGDHKTTAESVAKSAGILKEGSLILTGGEFDSLTEPELLRRISHVSVFARVTSEHKLRIVELLKKKGEIVAMTGDGVNDALALKKADVGVALGSGTEVAKEASEIVLLDDNFASLVEAVEEGRHSAMNIRRVIKYLFATNLTEIAFLLMIIFSPILFGSYLPLALLPIHILYVNLVTDGLCDVAIATERKHENLMDKKPSYFAGGRLFTSDVLRFMAFSSSWMFLAITFTYIYYLSSGVEIAHTRTVVFTLLSFSQLWSAMNARTSKQSIFEAGFFSNKFLAGWIGLSILVQLFVIYSPYMNELLKTAPLTLFDWAVILVGSSSLFVLFEFLKALERRGIAVLG